jgi:putative aminopeptidase FrvX
MSELQTASTLPRHALLTEILQTPSAPFREGLVLKVIEHALSVASVPFFRDPAGNLIVGASSQEDYLSLLQEVSDEPVRLFIAHMDHPGFIGTSLRSDGHLEVEWHGGTPSAHLVGAKVWLATQKGLEGYGKILEATLTPSGRSIARAVIELPAEVRGSNLIATETFGGFAFRAPVWEENGIAYTKAADDLVGSFCIVSLAMELFRDPSAKKRPFIGLLTRAEEVGFIGAIHHFELGWVQQARRPVVAVSLETSRTLPGAEVGKGPVVRLGDKFGVFDSRALRVLTQVAKEVLPGAHQKRIMDGGTCEATAAICAGLTAIGISVPLGNYHNQSLEGGPDAAPSMGPAPEFVHLGDVAGLLKLCEGLMKPGLDWANPFRPEQKEFQEDLVKYQALMTSGP